MKTSFRELQDLIRKVDFSGRDRTSKQSNHLPSELCAQVANFLTVQRCVHSEAEATSASSMDSVYKLEGCLLDDENSWWLSGPASMPGGKGSEYVEVRLTKKCTIRRVQSVSMRIPPLSVGPLSVREFRVDIANEIGEWLQLPFIFPVENRRGLQRFHIGDVDATSIRVVCLSNQISAFADPMILPSDMERVGFYAIKVE